MLLACWLAATPVRALDPAHHVSEYAVTGWTMEDGLPHNLVHAIAQDADGYLWIGSWEGVARFNGRSFTLFDRRSVPEVPLNGVRTILRDEDDAMLFGTTQDGVLRLANGTWSKLEPTVQQHLRVMLLHRARDGSLWIGTDRAPMRLWPDGRLETIGSGEIPAGVVFALLELGPDDMLIGTEYGVFRFHGGQIEHWGENHDLGTASVRALLRRGNGDIVLGGDRGAFIVVTSGEVRRILTRQIESLLEDRDGTLWLGISFGGLARYLDGRIQVIDESLDLQGRNSQALMEDREGLLWLGTTNGLYRINDAPAFGLGTHRGLGDDYPRTILNHHGTMFVGHARGLDRWNGEAFEPIGLGPVDTSVLALAAAGDGGLWLGTYDRGVLHVPADAGRDGEPDQVLDALPSRHIRALMETADGSLWIGTTSGLVRRRPDGRLQRVEDVPQRSDGFVRGLTAARDGGLWISLASGLMRWRPDGSMQKWLAPDDFPGLGSFDVLETDNDTVYIASDRGLLRLRNGQFTVYDQARGLPSETLFRVLQDAQGAIWLSSNHGAFRLDPAQFAEIDSGKRSLLSVDTLDYASGMPSSQCNGGSGPAGAFDEKGRLWLPTALGVAVIDPLASAARSRAQVPVRIEDMQVDGRNVPWQALQTLDASVNRVEIEYIGLYLRDPRGVRYRYRLLGFDTTWVDAGSDTKAVYTNLPPGRLHFEVQASMPPLDWDAARNIQTASLELERVPPFWRRPWFFVLLPFGLLGIALIWFSWRSTLYRRHQYQLTRLVEDRTHELRESNEALQNAGRERESLMQQLAWQASHDALTGLPNRRAGEKRLADAIREAETSGAPLSVALLDIDHFKRINDVHGHAVGDAVLRHVAAILGQFFAERPLDIARYGGEEFLLLLPGLALAPATARLRELVAGLANSRAPLSDGRLLACSGSIGVAQWHAGITPSQIVIQADRRLYVAKSNGRNQVVDQG